MDEHTEEAKEAKENAALKVCSPAATRIYRSLTPLRRSESQSGRPSSQTSPSASSNVSHTTHQSQLSKSNHPPAVYAAISSASLSLLATGIDSVFDIGSNVLLFVLHRKARGLDTNKWPVGGSRLETIGNIIYGSL